MIYFALEVFATQLFVMAEDRNRLSELLGENRNASNSGVIKSGWMRKKSSKLNVWGERYFVLKESTLAYYLKPKDPEPKDVLTLNPSCRVSEIRSDVTRKRKQFLFKIVWPAESEPVQNDEGKIYLVIILLLTLKCSKSLIIISVRLHLEFKKKPSQPSNWSLYNTLSAGRELI